MRADCDRVSRDHEIGQKEHARFTKPPYLIPTHKGYQPFDTWCIDCIVGLPASERGEVTLVVAVDAWSKWVECVPVEQLTSAATAEFLYNNIVARFGVPAVVRCDMGTEFQG